MPDMVKDLFDHWKYGFGFGLSGGEDCVEFDSYYYFVKYMARKQSSNFQKSKDLSPLICR